MSVLDFDKPQKIRSTKEHNEMYSSDSGVAGTFVPNMSEEDKNKWKAKHIKGDDERIEIRKNLDSQLLVIVYKKPHQPDYPVFPEYDGGGKDSYWEEANKIYSAQHRNWEKRHQNIRISMNGPCQLTLQDWAELQQAVQEAQDKMALGEMQDIINFDKEWFINKFNEVASEESNGEKMIDAQFKLDKDVVKIKFTIDCDDYGIHSGGGVRIIRGPEADEKSVRVSMPEILEGGDVECEFEQELIKKLNESVSK
jgi:hypothetical protein